jgi:hypothetical protein
VIHYARLRVAVFFLGVFRRCAAAAGLFRAGFAFWLRLRFNASIRSMTLSPRGSLGSSAVMPSPFSFASMISRSLAS